MNIQRTVATYTLGCRVNQYETEVIQGLFKNAGYMVREFDEKADVYVINTCTVTNSSDRKSRQVIRKAKKNNENAVVVVMGCYAQSSPQEVLKIQGVDIVIGNKNKNKIVDYVEEFMKNVKKQNLVEDIRNIKVFESLKADSFKERTRAFIKIQDGCNQFCSYCIIPYVRGNIRSKQPQEVIEEINQLVSNGYNEVVLTGIHTASYGKDLGNINLIDLVYRVYEIEGIDRIRFGSLEPNMINMDFINLVNELSDKICPHFHISLQSGCDKTLKRMNRKYTALQYEEAIKLLRKNIKDVLITTDVIVGFPGECDEEFEDTVEFLKRIDFYKIHVFKYSPRKGTPAAKFENQISGEIKEKRSEVLLEISDNDTKKYNSRYLGSTQKVLIEKQLKNGYYEGLTENYMRVLVANDEQLEKGNIYNVYLKQLGDNCILGEIEPKNKLCI